MFLNGNLQKVIYKMAKYGLYVALLSPLVITTSTFFPFIFGKAIFFQIVVEVVFFLWLILLALDFKKYTPRFSRLKTGVFVFFVVLSLASAFGVDRARSLWGNYERMGGLVTLFHYGAFFLLLGVFLKSKEEWLSFLRTFLGVGFLSFLFGILHKLGFSYWVKLEQAARMKGPLGNPVLFGSFMVFFVFLSAALFFWDEDRKWRLFYVASFIASLGAVFLTASRGPAAGLLAGFVGVMIIGILRADKEEGKKWFVAFGWGLLFLAVLFLVFQLQGLLTRNELLSRFTEISAQSSSAQSRLMNWEISLKGALERPFLGWGVENNHVVFARYFEPKVLEYSDKWFDKPHNKYIEVAVTAGFLGLVSYLALFYLAGRKLLKKFKSEFLFRTFLLGLILAYFVQALTLFDTPATYLGFFLILALVDSRFGNSKAFCPLEKLKKRFNVSLKLKRVPGWAKLSYGAVVILLMFFTVYQLSLRPFYGLQAGLRGVRILNSTGDSKKAELQFRKAAFWSDHGQGEIFYQTTDPLIGYAGVDLGRAEPLLKFASSELKEAVRLHPDDVRYRIALGKLYLTLASTDSRYFKKAHLSFYKAHKKAPKRPGPLFKLAEVESRRGHAEKAVEYARKAYKLNTSYGYANWILARTYFKVGNKDKGVRYLVQSFQRGVSWIKARNLGFADQASLKKLASIFERYLQGKNKDVKIHKVLVLIYKRLGEEKKIKEHLERAIEIDPASKRDFLQAFSIPRANKIPAN